jgi:hypothetical protein
MSLAEGPLLVLCAGPKLGYPAIPLPEFHVLVFHVLHVLALDQLFCGFNRSVVILAIKLNRPDESAVLADDVNAIIHHLRYPRRTTEKGDQYQYRQL